MNVNVQAAFFSTTPCVRRSFSSANSMYNFNIRFFEERMTPYNAPLAAGCTVVCAGENDDLGSDTIRSLAAGGTKLLALRTTGFANVNMAAAKAAGITVCRAAEYPPEEIAEYTLALLLTLTRKIHKAYCRVREGDFSSGNLAGHALHGKTAGIIGTGRIGKHLATLLHGFGTRVLAYDPEPDYEAAAAGCFKYVAFPELLRHSDIISLHCPLTPATVQMIGREEFERMKDGAILLNTSRSGLVDMQELLQAVNSGKLSGAALDIFEEESGFFPPGQTFCSMNNPLLEELIRAKNVLVTFKQGIQTHECFANTADSVLHNIACFFSGRQAPAGSFICTSCDGSRSCPGKTPLTKCVQQQLADGEIS